MTLSIAQSAAPHKSRQDYWTWSVWIEGPEAELDEIEEVEYVLHPSFKTRIRHSRSRANKFRLRSSGWGEFRILARLHKKSGEPNELRHWLRLEDRRFGAERPAAVKRELGVEVGRSVFLSFAASDSTLAERIRRKLETSGVSVKTANDAPTGVPLAEGVAEQIEQSDGTVVILSANESPWLAREIDIAREKSVPVIPVVVAPERDEIPESVRQVQRVVIKDSAEVDMAAESLAERITGAIRGGVARG